jgi:RNA polymerase sigma factor (sigma-70 family)
MTDLLRFNRQAAGGDLSSSDLLRLCGERLTDAALWKEFQSRFHKTILTFVMRVMCNAFRNDCLEEACDIAQEVYLRMLDNNGRMLRSFKGDTDFSVKAFLSRVAVNVVSDHHRRTTAEKRQPAEIISIEDAREQGRDLKGEAAELDIASILSWIDVERLMDSESDRRNAARNVLIFKLHHVDGFSVQEIAGFPAFGLKETAIRDALNQMRAHLQRGMGK